MERRNQSRQAPKYHQSEARNDQKSTHRHRRRRIEPPAQAGKDSPRLYAQQDASPQASADQFEKPLCRDQDYVRRWLAQMRDGEIKYPKSEAEQLGATATNHRPRGVTGAISRAQYPLIHETELNFTTAERRHNSSSTDSSILEAPARPRAQPEDGNESKQKEVDAQYQHRETRVRKRRASSSNSEVSIRLPSLHHETFERRPRHKTREDRYEPKNGKHVKEDGKEKKPSKKKVLKTGRKKKAKTPGEDLMRNFSSKNIGQERLTMRPLQGIGIFNNGRASSPAKRRGIPDLAFSEMDFLQQSYRQASVEKTQNFKSRTKSREKEWKKSQKAHEEIAEFFQPKRSVLQEIQGKNGGPIISKYRQDDNLTYSCEYDGDPLKQFGHATSYISWSDSGKAPASRSSSIHFNHRPESPIPDEVQKSIERTGIFKGTGIGDLEKSTLSEGSYSTQNQSAPHNTIAAGENLLSHESETMLLHSPETRSSVFFPVNKVHHQNPIHEMSPKVGLLSKINPPFDRHLPNRHARRSHVQAPQLGPAPRFQGPSDHRCPSPMTGQRKCRNSKLTAADRAQLAKSARIRQPSSTLSAIRVGSNGTRDGRANQDISTPEPGSFDKAADRGAEARDNKKLACERDMDRREEPIPQPAPNWPPKQQAPDASIISGSISGGLKTGPTTQENPTMMVSGQSISAPMLQIPASISSNTTSDHERTACISYLGLPVRGPSTVPCDTSLSMPISRLLSMEEMDPLFSRQLNEANRGNYCDDGAPQYQQPANYDQLPFRPHGDEQMVFYKDEMVDDNEVGDDYLLGSNEGQYTQQNYQTNADVHPFEDQRDERQDVHRSWRPDLTPIPEHSDEHEYENVDDHSWNHGDEHPLGQDPYRIRVGPHLISYAQGNMYHPCEMDEMEGFWRPQYRY